MDAFLYAIPDWLLFIFIVGGSVGLDWVGTVLLRRKTKAPMDEKHNEVVGSFSLQWVSSTLCCSRLWSSWWWEQYLAAESAVAQEAAALITVAHDTSSFPEPARGQVHDQLRAYAQFVINDEWRMIDEGTLEREESTGALAAINNVWSIYRSLPPSKVDPHTTVSLDKLSAYRAQRLLSNEAGLPNVLWFGLVMGAVITVCFCLVLHMKNVQLHAGVTALLAGLLSTSILMIVVINHPFAGDLHISQDAFRHAIYVIDSLPR